MSNATIYWIVADIYYKVCCLDDLSLDLSQSTGSGGRPWQSVSFEVRSVDAPDAARSIAQFLNSDVQFVSSVVPLILSSLLSVGTYNFVVAMCNFMHRCSVSSHATTVTDMQVPVVSISGAPFRVVKRSDKVVVIGDAFLSQLSSGVSESNGLITTTTRDNFTYAWSVKLNGILHNSSSTYNFSSTRFTVDPYWLLVHNVYTVELIALNTISGRASLARVVVCVQPSDIIAIIDGLDSGDQSTAQPRAQQQLFIGLGDHRALSAASSYDQDVDPSLARGQMAGLGFSWRCETLLPEPSLTCVYEILFGENSPVINVFADDVTAVNSSAVFSVTVYDLDDNRRSATASIVLTTVDHAMQQQLHSTVSNHATHINNNHEHINSKNIIENSNFNLFFATWNNIVKSHKTLLSIGFSLFLVLTGLIAYAVSNNRSIKAQQHTQKQTQPISNETKSKIQNLMKNNSILNNNVGTGSNSNSNSNSNKSNISNSNNISIKSNTSSDNEIKQNVVSDEEVSDCENQSPVATSARKVQFESPQRTARMFSSSSPNHLIPSQIAINHSAMCNTNGATDYSSGNSSVGNNSSSNSSNSLFEADRLRKRSPRTRASGAGGLLRKKSDYDMNSNNSSNNNSNHYNNSNNNKSPGGSAFTPTSAMLNKV